jgi:hypothetical protein
MFHSGEKYARMGNTLPSPTKLARLGHFPPASQAGRLAGPRFYYNVYSLGRTASDKKVGIRHLSRRETET